MRQPLHAVTLSATSSQDASRGRYSHINADSLNGDPFHHSPSSFRPGSRMALLAAAPVGLYKASVTRFGRRRGPALLCFCCLVLFLTSFAFHSRFVSKARRWPGMRGTSTVVFGTEQLRKIWEWEILSGHYPSTRPSEWWFLRQSV